MSKCARFSLLLRKVEWVKVHGVERGCVPARCVARRASLMPLGPQNDPRKEIHTHQEFADLSIGLLSDRLSAKALGEPRKEPP